MLNEAWISIKSNKLRSFLTILGIIIGVAAVVVMVAVGETVRNEINKELESFGGNKLIIAPGAAKKSGVSGGNRLSLTYQDTKALKEVKNVKNVAATVTVPSTIIYNGYNWNSKVLGITQEYFAIENIELERGSFFSDSEFENALNFAIIGYSIVENLYVGNEDPIGTTIRIRNVPFTVIGVTKEKGAGAGGMDSDDVVYIPLFSAKRKLTSNKVPDMVHLIYLTADTEENLPFVERRLENLLIERHSIADNMENDFQILNLKEVADKVSSIGVILSILLAAIASISLFVGSIGIMNMMLVSVTERTREIGIRKAIGAEEFDILIQFLFESILISIIGSLIGMTIGIILSQIGGAIAQKNVPISFVTVIVSIIIAFIVGVASGIVPARKATKLDPIEALRYQ